MNPAKRSSPSASPGATTAVRFTLPYLPAQQVFLAGSFNHWEPGTLALTEIATGEWSVQVDLPPGEYEYLFVVDGRWIADPNNPNSRPNPHGGHNSVIRVDAAESLPRPRRSRKS